MTKRSSGLLFILLLTFSGVARAQDVEPGPDNTAVAQNAPAAEKAQEPQSPPKENPAEPEAHGTRLHWQDIPKNVLHDQVAIFTSPFHINKDNAKLWMAFGGGTAAFIATDQRFSNHLPQRNSLTTPSKWASRIGSDYVLMPLWATFYVVGKAGDNPRARDTARLGIEAIIDADITAGILKVATQRPRPEVQGESLKFFTGGDAFPSGHSMKTFALARVTAREFPHPRIIPILAYGLASTVSVSRVGGRRHSPSDAFAGAAMGFFIGDLVYRHHHAPSEKATGVAWLAEHVSFSISP